MKVYSGYIAGMILLIGTGTILLSTELSNGGLLATAILGFASLFWLSRLMIDHTYFKEV